MQVAVAVSVVTDSEVDTESADFSPSLSVPKT